MSCQSLIMSAGSQSYPRFGMLNQSRMMMSAGNRQLEIEPHAVSSAPRTWMTPAPKDAGVTTGEIRPDGAASLLRTQTFSREGRWKATKMSTAAVPKFRGGHCNIRKICFAMKGILNLVLATCFALVAHYTTADTNFLDTDCSAPKANGGNGFCGPSQVRDHRFLLPRLSSYLVHC